MGGGGAHGTAPSHRGVEQPYRCYDDDYIQRTWEHDTAIELELYNWESAGCDPATHLVLYSDVSRRLSRSDIEIQASQIMNEPMDIQFPAMLAFVSFPDEWFTEVDLFYEDVRQFDSIVLAMDEQVFAAKQAGAIAAKRLIIATNKTQHNLEATPEEIRKHPDLAKAAILAELLRWTTKNQALRRQPRRQATNILTSRCLHMETQRGRHTLP